MAFPSLLSFFLPIFLSFSPIISTNSEGNALHALRTRLSDPTNVLQSWDPTLVNPCTWFHVTCDSNNHVIRLDLGNSNISGTLGSELGELKHLQYLELYRNNIGGKIPDELSSLENLVSMDLYGNKFEGKIPKSLSKLKSLRFLRLNDNKLTGSIPRELTTLSNLKVFDVSNNDLCGTIPVDGQFGSFSMESFDNNRLNGPELKGWYLGMVKTRPIATKSITSSLIYTAADFSSQTIVGETSEGYDFFRTLRMAGYGMLILGPSLHFWFNFVSRAFPKRDLLSTIKKMVLGQTVYGPVMTVTFFSVNAGLQGESGSEIVARLNRDLVPTMVSGIMYWPICDFVTFKFIPVHLQPLVSNSFSYLWTVYLTYMASLAKVSTD